MQRAFKKAKAAVVDLLKCLFHSPDLYHGHEFYPASEFTAEAERIRRRHSLNVIRGYLMK
jgi:hypothetical protein